MICLHPHCPMGEGAESWEGALDQIGVRKGRLPLLEGLREFASAPPGETMWSGTIQYNAALRRVLDACPCLFTQIPIKATARAMVHLCEVTLGAPIESANVAKAFDIQNPRDPGQSFVHPPLLPCTDGGGIMEALCSEVLSNAGLPEMDVGRNGWPVWSSPGHLLLNRGRASKIKLYGDILIPCLPHNLLISVKSVAARERLMVSGNRLESVGFGFFDNPREFWTTSRISLYRRWGFTAIYMPESTREKIVAHLEEKKLINQMININGNPLYRALDDFGDDMLHIAGRVAFDL